jgi:hypothetical protein
VAGIEPTELRISDTERDVALTALGEHMSTGRLDVDEYGDRSARIATAKTRGELLGLFTDLPAPHPVFDAPQPARSPAPTAAERSSDPVRRPDQRPLVHRLAAAVSSLSWIIAFVLFFSVHSPGFPSWLFFLLPVAFSVLAGAMLGDGWKNDRKNYGRSQRAHRRGRYD